MVKKDESDLLEEFIQARAAVNPTFPTMVEEAYQRRVLLREIATARKSAELSQTLVAARMNTSASSVARLEAGSIDPKISTLERFAAAVGKQLVWTLVDKPKSS